MLDAKLSCLLCLLTKYSRGCVYLPHSRPINSFCWLCLQSSRAGSYCIAWLISLLFSSSYWLRHWALQRDSASSQRLHAAPAQSQSTRLSIGVSYSCLLHANIKEASNNRNELSQLLRPQVRFPSETCRNRRLLGFLPASGVPATLGHCLATDTNLVWISTWCLDLFACPPSPLPGCGYVQISLL